MQFILMWILNTAAVADVKPPSGAQERIEYIWIVPCLAALSVMTVVGLSWKQSASAKTAAKKTGVK